MYISKCSESLDNQMFKLDNDNIKVFTNTGFDPNVCVTHSPTNTLRLEECGDTKYTALWNTKQGVNRFDACTKLEAENYIKDNVNIDSCPDKSYYIIYIDGIVKHIEECSFFEADQKYGSAKSKYPGGIGIYRNGSFIKLSRNNKSSEKILVPQNMLEYLSLKDKKASAIDCEIPEELYEKIRSNVLI